MVQRKTPDKLGIQTCSENYVPSSEKLYKPVKSSSSQISDIRSKGGGGPELKKIMKKSRSIKRSELQTSGGSHPVKRTKPQPSKVPPKDLTPVAASPKKTSPQSNKIPPPAVVDLTPKKPSPLKLPEGSPNYMKSTTSSSNARKERSQVTPQSSKTSSDTKSPISNYRKLSRESGHKPERALTKTSSLKPVRTLTKTCSGKVGRPSMKMKSGVALHPDQNVERATCSSTLKDSKFPTYVMLHPGETESEGTSVMKVCPYTYCSLNGHHHAQLPPLKHFMTARRRLLKTQKSMRLKNQSPVKPKRHGETNDVAKSQVSLRSPTIPEADSDTVAVSALIEEVELDYFVEIYARPKEDSRDVDGAIDAGDGRKDYEGLSDEPLYSEISLEDDLDHFTDFGVAGRNVSMSFPEQGFLQEDDGDLRGCAIGSGSNTASLAESEDDELIFETMEMDWEEGQVVDMHLADEDDLSAAADDVTDLKLIGKCYEEVPANEKSEVAAGENDTSLDAVFDEDTFSFDGGDHSSEIDLYSKINSEESQVVNYRSSDEDEFEEAVAANEGKDETPVPEDFISTAVFSDTSGTPSEESTPAYEETYGVSEPENDLHQEKVLLQEEKSACSMDVEYCTQTEEREECEFAENEIEKDSMHSENADALYDRSQQQGCSENAEDKVKEYQHEGMDLSISNSTLSEGHGDSESYKLKSVEETNAGDENKQLDDKSEIYATETFQAASNVTGAEEEATIINEGGYVSEEKLSENNSNPNRRVRRKRPTNNCEEPREFNPREPNFLPVIPDPEAEKVDLRHQMTDERKNAEEWMVDFALRQTVNKLAPARKRRVALLVEAFEAVIPVPNYKSHLQHRPAAFTNTRFIQACS